MKSRFVIAVSSSRNILKYSIVIAASSFLLDVLIRNLK